MDPLTGNKKWYGLENKYVFPSNESGVKDFQNLIRISQKRNNISNEEKSYNQLKNFIMRIKEDIIEKNNNTYVLPGLYRSEDIFETNKNLNSTFSYFIKVILIFCYLTC